jgi:hypothetical protein
MYYFKDDIVHKIGLSTKGRFVEKAEAYVYKDEKLLTTTKSEKELFKERIDETVFSPKEVCRENDWEYNQSMFAKFRKQFPEMVQKVNWSYSCADKNCSGNVELIITWISKNGSSSMKIFPIENTNESSSLSIQLANKLKSLISNSNRPKIYGEYVNCNDTLFAKILESNISIFKNPSAIKFNTAIDEKTKDYILDNAQKIRLSDNNIYELKILTMDFDGAEYNIGLVKTSQKQLNMIEIAKAKKKYTF